MPVDIPQWFVQKYSVNTPSPTVNEQPAKKEPITSPYQQQTESLLREPADTQQEREQLPTSAIPSTKRKVDPIILQGLEQKSPPILNQLPIRQIPSFEPGKRVFTDQKQLDKIIAEAPEEGRIVSFKEAFKRARQAGMPEFEYKGNRFNTQQAGETDREWLSVLKQNKTPQTFADYMERAGVTSAQGKNIDTSTISKKLGPALAVIAPIFKSAGITPEITSGQRNWNEWSLHEIGEAIDMRLKTANPQSIQKLEASLPGEPTTTYVEGEKGRMWTDGTYEYFVYGKGENIHLHIERESPETKQRLIEYMIESGLSQKIPRDEMRKYLGK